METGLRLSRKPGTTAQCASPKGLSTGIRKSGSLPEIPERRKYGSTAAGVIIYVALVLFAYMLGVAYPSKMKTRPVPTSSRTHCKQNPEVFDPAVAKGKTILVTGAAGFIGSYVAR
jgi:ABC-type Fe3+ transport system permease subunit